MFLVIKHAKIIHGDLAYFLDIFFLILKKTGQFLRNSSLEYFIEIKIHIESIQAYLKNN